MTAAFGLRRYPRAYLVGAAQGLLLCCGSIQAALPILAATFATVIACWLRAVNTLGTTIKVSICFAADTARDKTCAAPGSRSMPNSRLNVQRGSALVAAYHTEIYAVVAL